MAEGMEIMGSRDESTDGKLGRGVMIFVSDDNSTGVPVVGTAFFTPGGGSVESGLTGRLCIKVDTKPEVFPGIYYHVAHYAAFVQYA